MRCSLSHVYDHGLQLSTSRCSTQGETHHRLPLTTCSYAYVMPRLTITLGISELWQQSAISTSSVFRQVQAASSVKHDRLSQIHLPLSTSVLRRCIRIQDPYVSTLLRHHFSQQPRFKDKSFRAIASRHRSKERHNLLQQDVADRSHLSPSPLGKSHFTTLI